MGGRHNSEAGGGTVTLYGKKAVHFSGAQLFLYVILYLMICLGCK